MPTSFRGISIIIILDIVIIIIITISSSTSSGISTSSSCNSSSNSIYLKSYNCYKTNSYTYLPTPPLEQDMTQGQFFERSLIGLNSEFSFS